MSKQYYVYTSYNDKTPPGIYTSVDRKGVAIDVAKDLMKTAKIVRVFVTQYTDGKPEGLVFDLRKGAV